MRAIDLYSGIGGWSAGLRCAGIDVVEAYEIWAPAIRSYNSNLGTAHRPTDIRTLELSDLPEDISLVVGSPPCTEFSLSNRGGRGDILEGIKDVAKFFEIIDHLRPKYWLMENVPRTAAMIKDGLVTEDHPLHRFRHLAPEIKVIDLADFGLPQSRSRCFIGRFPFEHLMSLGATQPRRTLGAVIAALAGNSAVRDPVWKLELDRSYLTEMEPEPALNQEQLRMNREAKRFHPVYNDMPFPDRLDQPSRTVTATCTRVSRESIVVEDGPLSVRRLTVRERASLQGFPITYQFYASSHSQKVKMIGNAVPPLFAFAAGVAASNPAAVELDFASASKCFSLPSVMPDVTPPHAVGTSYPIRRRFRAALPGLRFKSGMRFQLSNQFENDAVHWKMEFFYGPSKDVRTLTLDPHLLTSICADETIGMALERCRTHLMPIRHLITAMTPTGLQERWRQSTAGVGPYHLVDLLGHGALALTSALAETMQRQKAAEIVLRTCRGIDGKLCSKDKLSKNSMSVLAGMILGSWFNQISWSVEAAPPVRNSSSLCR